MAVPSPASSASASSSRSKGKSRIEPDAPSPEAGSAERGARRPRKKKKEEAARPVLVAAPMPAKSSPRVEKLDERREAAERAPVTPRISGADVRRSPPPAARPKRELPPYLRVVK